MTASQKLSDIESLIGSGKTVIIYTATRGTKITPATWTRWAKNGHALLKKKGESLYMASGNKFVCIDHARIVAA